MKVLFLDIDGVLNSRRYYESDEWKQISSQLNSDSLKYSPHFLIDRNSIALLNQLVQCVPDMKIVVSSTWKRYGTYELTKGYLVQAGFLYPDSIIDYTPDLAEPKYCRGDEVQWWLDKHSEVKSYCIVDDDDDMLCNQLNNLVQTSSRLGLTKEDCEKIRIKLG
jgi:hypothetical protein